MGKVLPCRGTIRAYSVPWSSSSKFSFVGTPNPTNDSLRRGTYVKSTPQGGGYYGIKIKYPYRLKHYKYRFFNILAYLLKKVYAFDFTIQGI
jgi:hypothetical protein